MVPWSLIGVNKSALQLQIPLTDANYRKSATKALSSRPCAGALVVTSNTSLQTTALAVQSYCYTYYCPHPNMKAGVCLLLLVVTALLQLCAGTGAGFDCNGVDGFSTPPDGQRYN